MEYTALASLVGVNLESEKDQESSHSASEQSSAVVSARQRANKALATKIQHEVKRSQDQ